MGYYVLCAFGTFDRLDRLDQNVLTNLILSLDVTDVKRIL